MTHRFAQETDAQSITGRRRDAEWFYYELRSPDWTLPRGLDAEALATVMRAHAEGRSGALLETVAVLDQAGRLADNTRPRGLNEQALLDLGRRLATQSPSVKAA